MIHSVIVFNFIFAPEFFITLLIQIKMSLF